jgi:PIN like domain
LKFFFDQNLPPAVARALSALYEPGGHTVVHKNEKFPDRSILNDEEWITTLASEGEWIIVTRDRRMRRKRVHYAVLRQAALTAFFLQPAWDRIKSLELSHGLIHRWPG